MWSSVLAIGVLSTTLLAATGREASVIADHLMVLDQPDDGAFATGNLQRGDRVRVRRRLDGGWAEIDPPTSAIGWVERSGIDWGKVRENPVPAEPPVRGWVSSARAVVRSGRLGARMPGPPWLELGRGTMVRLVDRPPVAIGQGPGAGLWYAVVPPDAASCYVRDHGLREIPRTQGVPERLASYLVPKDDPKAEGSLPPAVAGEMARLDDLHRTILKSQPIDRWRFEDVRAGYQAILKQSGDNPAVEEALRSRLARLTRHEQAAAAAREFCEVLDRSRRRDGEIAWLGRRLAAVDAYRTVTYQGIGIVQPSSRLLDGRKLHALIGADGRTVAYLDIPPGLDLEAVGLRRVGVRGAVHFNQDLGTRLITVRDVEPVGSRR